MIVTGLLKLLMAILMMLVFFLPSYTPPPPADLSAFGVIAWLVPVNEIVTLTAALVGFAVASMTYVAANWVINKVRGSG